MELNELSDIYSLANDAACNLDTPDSPSAYFQDLDNILRSQLQELQSISKEELKIHQLPLARVKKIMKSDEDVRMISAETPLAFSKACEFFVLELTHRAWLHTESENRKTLQRSDIVNCISSTIIFDFLIDVIL